MTYIDLIRHALPCSFEYQELDSASSKSYRDVIFNSRIANRRQEGLSAGHSIEGEALGAGRQAGQLGPQGRPSFKQLLEERRAEGSFPPACRVDASTCLTLPLRLPVFHTLLQVAWLLPACRRGSGRLGLAPLLLG